MHRAPHHRSRTRRRAEVAVASGALAALLLSGTAATAGPNPGEPAPIRTTLSIPSPPGGAHVRVLVFHASATAESPTVDAGIAAIESIGRSGPAAQQFRTEATDDAAVFTDARRLGRYNAVVFLTGGGDVLDPEQEAGLETYMEAGGGFLGIHDAARTEPYSDWFTGLVGARPAAQSPATVQRATVEAGDRRHPATRQLPLNWKRPDKWLNWSVNPSGSVHTVARVKESTYQPGPGANGWDHPISWCRDYDGGRSFYTGMGGTAASFAETDFRDHLRGALLWTTRLSRADCKATIDANYTAERVTRPNQPGRNDQIGEPHGLVAAPDGRILYIGRGGADSSKPVVTDWNNPDIGKGKGEIHVYDPRTKTVRLAGELTVFGNKGGGDELTKNEEGLLGIELDPDFLTNGWVYLHYTPHARINRDTHMAERYVSRFTLDPATSTLDLASEKVLLKWPVQIHSCCHAGGGMAWDSKENLYIATGDNNSSGFSGGYAGNNPEPDFKGVSFADARRTSGNTNNLNGKILRIHPEDDGTYTLPEGNLFTGQEPDEGGGKTRGEIYVMGVRNPARIFVDKRTDILYAGWVGPDAGAPSTTWGPAKYDTFAAITRAGNHGWPYCMGNNQPYRDRNLPDPGKPLGWYDCARPKNESPNNDGLVNLPPVTPNTIWYSPQGGGVDYPRDASGVPSYRTEEQKLLLPWLKGGGQATMNGPVYRYDAASDSTVKWPAYWDGKWFVGDFYDGDQPRHAVLTDPRTVGKGGLPVHAESLKKIIPVGPGGIRNLMDWKFAPDGSLYVLDYGRGFFTSDAQSALWRVTYKGGEPTPAADFLARKEAAQ
ncbi:ThuA domain-containing protein [Streptomyces sp. WAC05374]|uniref:ThuA domain-containing protein n=1 Tax=Streptomyces sp. WAC05374 TaxID=2487420 RepID=UPI000F8906B6|nr:ThuA domain-containing protein [Streptomyces sp. WAC05374]RST17365.1 ThuA domain-containing protein [Streptomyces sp. WAC05374]TDF45951.1 ThuA domain-containing protein [Streptomyces sp. WAC05374]TDF48040.1 ThuA domain-containing protein [Streptomyces sp. WAC05374]TDF52945.1 ThuA domain-containing protein [Streptomyces sp. WAC05374]